MTRIRIFLSVLLALATVATPVAAATTDGFASNDPSGAAPPDCDYSVELRDASGETMTLTEPASRVVTTGPAAAQTMWEVGARDKVVGVTQFASYLEGASAKANVSGAGRQFISVERVVAQTPDVVLAENITSPETVQKLRDSGLTVYYFNNSESIGDVYQKVAVTGTIVGECDGAVETVRRMKTELEIVREATADEPARNFLYSTYGYTAGANTFISSGLTAAGGNNVAVGEVEFPPSGYAQINAETVVALDIDWIVYPGTPAAIPDTTAWNQTTAVQDGNLIAVDTNRISQPAPRVAYAIRDVAKAWYPDAYASANESMRGNVDVTVDIYASDDDTPGTATSGDDASTGGADATTAAPGTSSDDEATADGTAATTDGDAGSQPGFGFVGVVVAVALLVGVGRRHRE